MRVSESVVERQEVVTSVGELIFCRRCRAVHRVSVADRAPLFGDDGSFRVVDDRHRFLHDHGGHELRLLWRRSENEFRDGPRSDPMTSVTWEVTDGRETFLVTSERRGITEPRTYRIRRGHLALLDEWAELDARVLASLLDEELYPHAASPERLAAVVDSCRELVRTTPVDAFQPVDEDRHQPDIALACLPPAVVETLSRRIDELFPPPEARRLRDLVGRELQTSIPVVRIRHRYEIHEG